MRVDDRDKLVASERIERLTAEGNLATCQKEQERSRRIGAGVVAGINQKLAGAPGITAATPARRQQANVVRYYVDQKLVPTSYLRDTVTVAVVDSALVAAANTANLWLDIYRGQIDSISTAYGTERVAAESAELRADEEREARQDCQDENQELRKREQSQRKRNFWAVVKGVGVGAVAGIIAAVALLR